MGITKSKEAGTGSKGPAKKPATANHGGKIYSADKAKLELKLQRDQLAKAQRRSDRLCSRLDDDARAALREGKRDKALALLKRKKLYVAQLERVGGMQSRVEESIIAIESAQMEKQVLDALRGGSDALRAIQKDMGDVEKAVEDMQEAVADAQAVSDLLSEHIGPVPIDEDALEAELMQLAGVKAPKTKADDDDDKEVAGLKVPDHKVEGDAQRAEPAREESPVAEQRTRVAA